MNCTIEYSCVTHPSVRMKWNFLELKTKSQQEKGKFLPPQWLALQLHNMIVLLSNRVIGHGHDKFENTQFVMQTFVFLQRKKNAIQWRLRWAAPTGHWMAPSFVIKITLICMEFVRKNLTSSTFQKKHFHVLRNCQSTTEFFYEAIFMPNFFLFIFNRNSSCLWFATTHGIGMHIFEVC